MGEETELRRALEDAAEALDEIASSEGTAGNRNSYPAQVARSALRQARAVLSNGTDGGTK